MKMILQTPFSHRVAPLFSAAMILGFAGFCNVAEAVTVRFLPLSEALAERKIGLQDGKGLTELKNLNPKKRSEAYPCATGEEPPTLVALDRERPGGKPSGVAIVLTANLKAPLVLILEDEDHPSGLRAIVIEDGEDGFAWGSLRFVNTADKAFMIRCDKETLAIPESFGMVDIALGGGARNIGVQLYSEEEPDAVLYSAVWEHDPNFRKLIFIVPHEDPAIRELTLSIVPQDKRADH